MMVVGLAAGLAVGIVIARRQGTSLSWHQSRVSAMSLKT